MQPRSNDTRYAPRALALCAAALCIPARARAQEQGGRQPDPPSLASGMPAPVGEPVQTVAPTGEAPHYYHSAPQAFQRFGLRIEGGGGARFVSSGAPSPSPSPSPSLVLGVGVPVRVGFGVGRYTPALWTDLGYLYVSNGAPTHLFAVGAGVGYQSVLFSVGYLPRVLLGTRSGASPAGASPADPFVWGLRQSLQFEFLGPLFAVALSHQMLVEPAGIEHEVQLTASVDVLGIIFRVTGVDRLRW